MRATCLEMVYQMAREDERIVFIGSDLGVGTLDKFKREMPGRFFMEGISEAHVIGMAAGMAMEGKIVYVNTIATFITRRCFEQIAVDLCMHRAKVRLLGSGAGFAYAPLGPTHQATEDLAILRPLPGISIFAPADAGEMKRLMPLTVDIPGPVYVRQGKGGDPIVTDPAQPFKVGKPYLLKSGGDTLLVTTGTMAKTALDAAAALDSRGLPTSVLHLPTLKPLDVENLQSHLAPARVVVSIEEHTRVGGLGTIIAEVLSETPFPIPKRFTRMGIPDRFADQYGSQATLLTHFELTPEALIRTVLSLHGDLSRSGHE
jgi:transketolase